MPEPKPKPVHVCATADLEEGGKGALFGVLEFGREPVSGFALRFEGKVVAYLNRCMHVPTELDWQPGEFLDDERQWILCSMHGAVYDPRNGLCVSGPCVKRRLHALDVREEGGAVYWYPDERFQAPPTPAT